MTLLLVIMLGGEVVLAQQPTKVEMCHFNADDDPDAPEWQLLEVGGKAVDAHEAHGDGFPGGEVPGTSGQFVFDENCVPQASELIFAVAYIDINTTDGGFNPDVDVLIAKLVDGPGAARDEILGAGDLVITDKYPKRFDADEVGSFKVTQHEVSSVSAQGSESCQVLSESGAFTWEHVDQFLEVYNESVLPFFAPFSFITDGFETAAGDTIRLNAESPSQPTDELELDGSVFTDQPFIDVELSCSSEPLSPPASPPASPPVSPPTSPPMSPPISQHLIAALGSPEGGFAVGAGFLLVLGTLSKTFYSSLTPESVSGRHLRRERAWLRRTRSFGARGVSGRHMRRPG
jgi:hypothetical protein